MHRKGFTIIELLVVVAVIGLLVAILLPAIGRARESAQSTQSQSNLRNIGSAAAVYSVDFQDRQWSPIPEDFGKLNPISDSGQWTRWAASRCSGQLRLGKTASGDQGFFIPLAAPPLCPPTQESASINNLKAYFPCSFRNADGNFGSFRLLNASSFSKYVGGRFYDDIFYAPKDLLVLDQISALKAQYPNDGDFFGTAKSVILSSYCWSPAAMWSPDCLSWSRATAGSAGGASSNKIGARPDGLAGAYKSPAASLSQYPSLKWRVWEHQWLQNQEGGEINPCFSSPTPWYYNHGYNSAPCVMFFDGHTQVVSVAGCMQDNDLALSQGRPLWFQSISGTWDGYFSTCAYDMLTNAQPGRPVTAGVATVDGILGRDMLRLGD